MNSIFDKIYPSIEAIEKPTYKKTREISDKYRKMIKELEMKRDVEIKEIIDTEIYEVNKIILENVQLTIGEMLFCEIHGYGYFNRIENGKIVMDVCTKGGLLKGYEFSIPVRLFGTLRRIKK